MVVESAGSFTMQLSRLHSAIGTYLEDHEDSPVREEILQFILKPDGFWTSVSSWMTTTGSIRVSGRMAAS